MKSAADREIWGELVGLLQKAGENIGPTMLGNGSPAEIETVQESVESFRAGAGSMGLSGLERAAGELEAYVVRQVKPGGDQEAAAVFSFAVSALLEQMRAGVNGGGDEGINVEEVRELLGAPPLAESREPLSESDFPPGSEVGMETGAQDPMQHPGESVCFGPQPPSADVRPDSSGLPPPASGFSEGLSHLEQIVTGLGGELTVGGNGNGSGPAVFSLTFPASAAVVGQIETLLSVAAPWEALAPGLPQDRFADTVATIKEFMLALSSKEMDKAQEILLRLAEQQPQAGLFKEIGSLARELHTQMRGFVSTLDPALKDMVEEKLPDSGNRLEHMLQLTEKAATTTLDCVDAIQERIGREQGLFERLDGLFDGLQPLSDEARKRIGDGKGAVEELRESAKKSSEELDVILTAQDFQDLTGQIILKIMQLLKDLEQKLMNVIKTFGVRVEEGRMVHEEELYGPAHKEVKEALHSQDDVDALLADFGF